MKTIQEMAVEAGFAGTASVFYMKELERFAALVRADLYKEMHDPMVLACKKMVAEEREACAKVADDYFGFNAIADSIRARSNT